MRSECRYNGATLYPTREIEFAPSQAVRSDLDRKRELGSAHHAPDGRLGKAGDALDLWQAQQALNPFAHMRFPCGSGRRHRHPVHTNNTLESLGKNAMVKPSPIPHGLGVLGGKRGRLRDASVSLAAMVALTACAHTPEPKIVTQVVKVPVAAACIPSDLNLDPTYPDTDAALRATAGPDDMLTLLAAGRLLRVQTLAEWRAALKACK